MKYWNEMTMKFSALSVNESFARSAVAGFCVQLNPTLDEVMDIKTAVSEAVTNCVVHAYPKSAGEIELWVGLGRDCVAIEVRDKGVGIEDLEKAREPLYTTKPMQERAGMGFVVMESFMDVVELRHNTDKGVVVRMEKKLGRDSMAVVGG